MKQLKRREPANKRARDKHVDHNTDDEQCAAASVDDAVPPLPEDTDIGKLECRSAELLNQRETDAKLFDELFNDECVADRSDDDSDDGKHE